MKIIVRDKEAGLTSKQKQLIIDKFKNIPKILKKFRVEEKTANLKVEKGSRWGYIVNFSMPLPKKRLIIAEAKDKSFRNAINELKDLVVRQVTDYKEKLNKNKSDF
jgi:ribosome-associated translation inhibitor RaiA